MKGIKLFFIALAAFLAAALLTHIYLSAHPDLARTAFASFSSSLLKKIPRDASGIELFLFILSNNLIASALMTALGLIPFLFLPIFGALANGASLGITTSMAALKGYQTGPVLLFSVAPHGLFEIPAFLFAVTLGLLTCLRITNQALSASATRTEDSFLSFSVRIIKRWLAIVLPLLLLAAAVEAFITPLLVHKFLKT